MMEELGMDYYKDSILTLKNYGICDKSKCNFEEATDMLERAERAAERELGEVHL